MIPCSEAKDFPHIVTPFENLSYIKLVQVDEQDGYIFLFLFTNCIVFDLSPGWGGTELARGELRKIKVSSNHFEPQEHNVMATVANMFCMYSLLKVTRSIFLLCLIVVWKPSQTALSCSPTETLASLIFPEKTWNNLSILPC